MYATKTTEACWISAKSTEIFALRDPPPPPFSRESVRISGFLIYNLNAFNLIQLVALGDGGQDRARQAWGVLFHNLFRSADAYSENGKNLVQRQTNRLG
jgi:hypothetical protein